MAEEQKEPESNGSITVCVTGASGFIASHCIHQLLQKGYNVNGTVRGDPSDDKYKWLSDISTNLNINSHVKLFQADLLKEGSFNEAFADCDYIFHVASPFWNTVKDPYKDLVEPAKMGTLNVLNCCLNACKSNNGKLKRVVLTASVTSICGIGDPTKLYDENDWNTTSTLNSWSYSFSKTEAERCAWSFMDENEAITSFDLIAIHPSMVLGKHLNDNLQNLNESNAIILRMIDGVMFAKINIALTVVDVRDVAAAHVLFIDNENAKENGKGRYICANEYATVSWLIDYCDDYCEKHKLRAKLPCCRCDYKCCWCCLMCSLCFACCLPFEKEDVDYLKGSINKGIHYDNSKLKAIGMEFRDTDTTMNYTLDYLRDAGFIKKK